MTRKKPVWTKAMRKAAAEHGRQGGRAAKARAGQLGGLISWGTRSDAERAAIVARLRECGGRQRNRSAKARAAQAERGRRSWAAQQAQPMTAEKAAFLKDAGVLRGVPAETPRATPEGRPRPEDYANLTEWMRAVDTWDSAQWRKLQSKGGE